MRFEETIHFITRRDARQAPLTLDPLARTQRYVRDTALLRRERPFTAGSRFP